MYALMKVALGRRGSVGPGLPLLAALVAAMAALLIAYNASPARAADDNCTPTGTTTTCTFASTGTEQTFQVPDGVSSVHVVAIGAPGAVGSASFGVLGPAGRGARVSGDLTVKPGDPLYVEVGGAPTGGGTSACFVEYNCIGGFNGGGSSGRFAGGGGGASDVRTVASGQDGSLASRLIVGGGGGGSGSSEFCRVSDDELAGGAGGDAGSDGGNGAACASLAGGTGGKAGGQNAGGAGGSPFGQSGLLGQGGNAGNTGAGGGGGYYGGGGGGNAPSGSDGESLLRASGGGGGGGSNLVPEGGTATITSDSPSVTISYTTPTPPDTTPPTLTVTHTADGTNGWNKTSPVTVNVSASDSGSGLAGAPTCQDGTTDLTLTAGATAGTWTTSVSGDGTHAISCSVSDNSGNSTTSAIETVKIDTTAPSVSGCSVTPSTLRTSANNHKLVTVRATAPTVTDSGGSGANGFTLLSVASNQADSGLARDDVAGDIQGWDLGTADIDGKLRAERYGSTRIYTLTYRGYDLAGNAAECSATVTVPKGG